MAVRIRKLAKELRRPPVELIGVLHALGYERYRSPEDMLSAAVEQRLRRGLQRGVQPVSVDVKPARRPAADASVEAVAEGGDDLMSRLVPGVVPSEAKRPRPRRPAAPERPARTPRTPPPVQVRDTPPPAPAVEADHGPSLSAERRALASLQRRVAAEQEALSEREAELEARAEQLDARERSLGRHQAALDELERALEAERATLEAQRARLAEAPKVATAGGLPTLEDLLDARGLRGADEYERAVAALARGRHLRDVLWALRVDPPEAVERVLRERLLLTDGPGDGLPTGGAAAVCVAPDRAEVPSESELDRQVSRLSEQLLLNGWRRLLVVGGRAAWHPLVRARLDERVEGRFLMADSRSADAASEDVRWADVVVLVDVSLGDEAEAAYRQGATPVIRSNAQRLGELLDQVGRALQG